MGGEDIFDNWVTQFQGHYISHTGEMYIGHGRLCVCVYPSPRSHTAVRTQM